MLNRLFGHNVENNGHPEANELSNVKKYPKNVQCSLPVPCTLPHSPVLSFSVLTAYLTLCIINININIHIRWRRPLFSTTHTNLTCVMCLNCTERKKNRGGLICHGIFDDWIRKIPSQ